MRPNSHTIILSGDPQGRFHEGTITGTPKPGTIMQIDVSEGINDNGRFTWEAFNRSADGDFPAGPLAILLPKMEGNELTAYVTGDHGYLYTPAEAEEFNLLLADVAGTADDHVFGELLMVDDGTGKLIAETGSPEHVPFMLCEDVTNPTADQLVHVIFRGF